MGQVKEAVKGKPTKAKPRITEGNLIDRLGEFKDEISKLTSIKDEDADKESKAQRAENVQKAALLRAVHSLLTASVTLLEEY